MSPDPKRLKVLMACSGLGRINRGFESFTRECFAHLRSEPSLDLYLFKGGGESFSREIVVPSFARDGAIAKALGKATGRGAYIIEQLSFSLTAIPRIAMQRPDVVFFSDVAIGNALWHYRRRTKARFALLFSNGGPASPAYERWDMVQQVSPEYVQNDPATGLPFRNQVMVPYGFDIPKQYLAPSEQERIALRQELGLPGSRTILISVGAINAQHKRMDYVLRELASIPEEERPYLIMLGAQDPRHAQPIVDLAAHLLPQSDYTICTVPPTDVARYLRASDIFALASLQEGFGRVYVEALANGLPVIAHDFATARFVLGPCGKLRDLTKEGALASAVMEEQSEFLNQDRTEQRIARYIFARDHFSWDHLRPAYVDMIQKAHRSF